MRILIADDHPVIRRGLSEIIESEAEMKLIGQATDAQETIELAHRVWWDVAVIDYSMPGADGTELIKRLKADYPRRPLIVFSEHSEEIAGLAAIKAGASGYISKECAADELLQAIRKVASGGKYIGPRLAEKMAFELARERTLPVGERLSERERYVAPLLASGMKVKEIGQELSLSPNTISTYRCRILRKLGLRNNAELIRYVIQTKSADEVQRSYPLGIQTHGAI